jgi:hypothetical protein
VRVLTSVLEITAAVLFIGAAYLAFGLAACLAVAGGTCLGLSYALTRGGSR